MNTMEFKDDAWSWTEEHTTLEEQDGETGIEIQTQDTS